MRVLYSTFESIVKRTGVFLRKIDPILTRIKKVLNAKTDREMCQKWGISYSTLDTWKNRDKIPEKRLLDFSAKYGVSLDWLLTGEPKNSTSHTTPPTQDLPPDILTILDYLKEMPKEKRKEVLRFILDMGN